MEFSVVTDLSHDDMNSQVGFISIFKQFIRYKWAVIIILSVVAGTSVWVSLKMPNVYMTTGIYAPATDKKSGLSGLGSQIGGLASLAGINLSSGGAVDKTDLAIELLRSKDFIARFIGKYDLKVPLMAAKGWDQTQDVIVLDPKIYDPQAKRWMRNPIALRVAEPTLLEAAEQFGKQLEVSKDKTTSMVKISFQFYSPQLTKKWVDLLVMEVNDEIRNRDIEESQASIKYLNEQLALITISDIRDSVIQIIQDQTKTLMLTNIRKEYVLKTVDPAFIPEEKFKPRRAIIVLMSCFSAFLFLMFIAYVKSIVLIQKEHRTRSL
jgi:uncharacterized protein involved in exopolysaccharide biosynthesis